MSASGSRSSDRDSKASDGKRGGSRKKCGCRKGSECDCASSPRKRCGCRKGSDCGCESKSESPPRKKCGCKKGSECDCESPRKGCGCKKGSDCDCEGKKHDCGGGCGGGCQCESEKRKTIVRNIEFSLSKKEADKDCVKFRACVEIPVVYEKARVPCIDSGSFTPSHTTNITSPSSVTPQQNNFQVVGNVVTLFGTFNVNASALGPGPHTVVVSLPPSFKYPIGDDTGAVLPGSISPQSSLAGFFTNVEPATVASPTSILFTFGTGVSTGPGTIGYSLSYVTSAVAGCHRVDDC